jgi:amidase
MKRRDFLINTAGFAAAIRLNRVFSSMAHSDGRIEEIVGRRLSELATFIQKKELSSLEVVTAYVSRIEDVNERLNALIQWNPEEAIRLAKKADADLANGKWHGPLHGIPFTIKDSFDTVDFISTAGTIGRKAYKPPEDATIVKRLKAAGGILVGKTNTPELTLDFKTKNAIYGQTNNPFDLKRTSGGSSGGAAALIGVGGIPFDIGTDTGGSVRLPAHFCGIAGIKPSAGRVPRTGHIIDFVGHLEAMTHVGPMARFVDDLDYILQIIHGPDGVDPFIPPVPYTDEDDKSLDSLRVGWFAGNGVTMPDEDTNEVLSYAVESLNGVSQSIQEIEIPGSKRMDQVVNNLWLKSGGGWVRRLLDTWGTSESLLMTEVKSFESELASDYNEYIEEWYRLKGMMLRVWNDVDAVVCPVNTKPAILHETEINFDHFSYTQIFNMTGWPSTVVRCGESSTGLPIGIQVLTPPWKEKRSLAIARFLEDELGGWKMPEPFKI